MPKFNERLRKEILLRDRGYCQICGDDQNLEVAHIPSKLGHRGMGSKESVNVPKNLLVLCHKHHLMLDKRKKPYMEIHRFEPDNKANGLLVSIGGVAVAKHKLWFYRL